MKKLAETCEFGGYREEGIRDRFVCGLKERTIQRKLLAVVDLTLQTAVERACAAELTEKETTAWRSVEEVRKVAATFPRVFPLWKSQSLVGHVFRSQLQVLWLSKGGSHCEEMP